MDRPPLPDDIRKWPDDPWELLGISRLDGHKDVRRAYVRLIRKYKPEHHPEEFQKIRAAYDQLQYYVSWQVDDYGMSETPSTDSQTEPADDQIPTAEPDEPITTDDDGIIELSLADEMDDRSVADYAGGFAATIEEQCDAAWKKACQGDYQNAFQELHELHRREPGREDVCLRLYWLQTICPELTNQTDSISWLVAAMKGARRPGAVDELYRRHIESDPAEALSLRFTQVLNECKANDRLGHLIRLRWLAANRLGKSRVILGDIPKLRKRFGIDDEEEWCRLLLLAMDYLAFLEGDIAKQAFDDCFREIESATHLHMQLSDELDQWRHYDYAVSEDDRSTDEIKPVVERFLRMVVGRTYASFRKDLMQFCLREAIHPGTVGHVAVLLGVDGDGSLDGLDSAIERDGATQFVYTAWRAFVG